MSAQPYHRPQQIVTFDAQPIIRTSPFSIEVKLYLKTKQSWYRSVEMVKPLSRLAAEG